MKVSSLEINNGDLVVVTGCGEGRHLLHFREFLNQRNLGDVQVVALAEEMGIQGFDRETMNAAGWFRREQLAVEPKPDPEPENPPLSYAAAAEEAQKVTTESGAIADAAVVKRDVSVSEMSVKELSNLIDALDLEQPGGDHRKRGWKEAAVKLIEENSQGA